MAIETREQLIEALARIGLMGLAREGDLDSLFEGGGATSVTVADITDSTVVGKALMKAVDAAAARTAIGAGTSNLAVGTAASQAKAGNYTPSLSEIQAVLAASSSVAMPPVDTDRFVIVRGTEVHTVTVAEVRAYITSPA